MKFRAAALCVGLIGISSDTLAQIASDGSVRGYVKDEQGGVLPGVTLTAKSPTVGGTNTVVTDSRGYYRLLDLPPGEYTITAERQGFATLSRPNVLMRAGLNLTLDLIMKVGAMTEAVEVKLETPMLESKSAVQAINISGDLQRSLPITTRRDWADFLMVTPGVVSTEALRPVYALHGADPGSTVVQVDGVDVASAQQSSPAFTNLNTDAIQDVQIKTGAVDAATPLGVGAAFNVVTRSGTNAFSGAFGLVFQDERWRADNNPGGTLTGYSVLQGDASLGGPIVRDRWWFFAAYREARTRSGVGRSPEQLANLRAVVPGFTPFDAEQRGHFWFGKTTVQVTPKQRLLLFHEYSQNPADSVTSIANKVLAKSYLGGSAYAASLSSVWGTQLTSRMQVSYNDKAFYAEAVGSGPSRTVYQTTSLSGGRRVGAGAIASLDNSQSSTDVPYSKVTVALDTNYFKSGWIGSHEVQAGLYAQFLHSERNVRFVNDGYTLEELVLRDPLDPAAGVLPFHRVTFEEAGVTNTKADSRDIAVYLQDAWKPTARLTLNAGLRLDFVDRRDKLFDLQTQASTEVGPRVGMNYSVTADGRNILRASWSRVHDALSTNLASVGISRATMRDAYDTNLDGEFETVLVTPGSTAALPDRIFDQSRHQPRVDEWSAGFRRQFPGQVSLDVGFLRREFRDQTAFVEVNGIYEDGIFRGYRNEALNEVYSVTNNKWNWPVYSAVTFQAAKHSRSVQFIGSYTRQWRHLAGGWQPNDPASFIQPDAFPNDRGLGGVIVTGPASANSLAVAGAGDGIQWRDHAVRIGLAYQAPLGIQVATTYVGESGLWSGPVFAREDRPDPRFGPPTLRLSNGRVVSNPLATVFRFAGRTRADRQFTSPPIHIWNIRFGRRFHVASGVLEFALSVFNVTNNDADQQLFVSGTNQLFSPNFGKASDRQYPRSTQLAARWSF